MTHYLDHAATSPILPAALDAWVRAQHDLGAEPGNPAALHAGGRRAKRMLEDARERIGAALGAERAEVVLVSGATESDALGVCGAARGARRADPVRTRVLLSVLEHDAVGAQREVLEADGFDVSLLRAGRSGVVEFDAGALSFEAPSLALATLGLICSEIGTIQPVAALAAAFGAPDLPPAARPLVHTDAAQAIGVLPVSFRELGVDLLSLGGHKVGAPVGTGVLLARRGVPFATDRPGGGHERGLRSGTPDVAGALALATALEETVRTREERRARAEPLRDRLIAGLPEDVRLTVDPADAVPSIIHLSLPTSHPEAVLMAMDGAGVAVSAGSACHAGVTRPSAVLLAMGASEAEALGVLRVSTGPDSADADIDALLAALPGAIRAARALDARESHRVSARSHPLDERAAPSSSMSTAPPTAPASPRAPENERGKR